MVFIKEAITYNEYNTSQNNKMIIRIAYKASYMKDKRTTTVSENMNVIILFPDTSDNSDYIIDEVRLILLDIFEKNIKKQFSTNSAP